MASSVRDRISVDLRGLSAPLAQRASKQGVSLSEIVRVLVFQSLSHPPESMGEPREAIDIGPESTCSASTRLSLRVTPEELARLDAAAESAGLSRSAYLRGLVDGIPVLLSGGRKDLLPALIRSSSELSTFSRNVRHLADLLRSSDGEAAMEYRQMLDGLAEHITQHLKLAGALLFELTPARNQRGHAVRAQRS